MPIAAGQHGGVLADEILGRHVVLVLAFADRGDRHSRQGVDLPSRRAARRRRDPWPASICVEHLADDEDFFLGDAEQIVVVGGPLDDRPGGAVQVGRFVDDDRRIARPGHDRPLARLFMAALATAGPPVTQISLMPR